MSILLTAISPAEVATMHAGAPELHPVFRERAGLVGEHVLDLPEVLINIECPALEPGVFFLSNMLLCCTMRYAPAAHWCAVRR